MTHYAARERDSPFVGLNRIRSRKSRALWLQPVAIEQNLETERNDAVSDGDSVRLIFGG